MNFAEFFSAATGIANGPFDYQRRLACGERPRGERDDNWLSRGTNCESKLINIPTGLGKTALLFWLGSGTVFYCKIQSGRAVSPTVSQCGH